MTRNELHDIIMAGHAEMDRYSVEQGPGLPRRILDEHNAEWHRLYSRQRALCAICDGHADEVRAALRECGVYEGGEVQP